MEEGDGEGRGENRRKAQPRGWRPRVKVAGNQNLASPRDGPAVLSLGSVAGLQVQPLQNAVAGTLGQLFLVGGGLCHFSWPPHAENEVLRPPANTELRFSFL